MGDIWKLLDERISAVAEKVEVNTLRLDGHDAKLELYGTRLGGYADAELAYRRARDELQTIQEGNADAYRKMLEAAKTQLSASVLSSMEKLKEPLSVVADIREAQHKRHAREEVLLEHELIVKTKKAEDDKERAERREFFIKMAVAGGALLASLGTAISAYLAMRGH